jgi:hypothetical protein
MENAVLYEKDKICMRNKFSKSLGFLRYQKVKQLAGSPYRINGL